MSPPSTPSDPPPSSSLANDLARGRTHLGNERTHLAYLRTTVSLIGFGITINRFSTYLIQNDQAPKGGRLMLHDASNAGFGMVLLGLALLVWSLVRYRLVTRDIERGVVDPRHRATAVFPIGRVVLAGLTAVWLFTS